MYFFFKHTATTDIYPDVPTLSLPDSLPISNAEDPRTPATSETTHSRTSSIFGSLSSAGPMEKNAWNVALSGSEERSVQIQWLLPSGMSGIDGFASARSTSIDRPSLDRKSVV